MLPDSSKSLVSCCGYNMGMIKWTGNDLLTSKTIKIYILPKPYKGISRADWSRAMADKSTGRENDNYSDGTICFSFRTYGFPTSFNENGCQ